MRHDAILNVHSNVTHIFGDNEAYDENHDLVELDEEKVQTETKRLQNEYDSQEYARKRELEYPSVQECVHAILDDDLDALQTKRTAIKAKYPKSS